MNLVTVATFSKSVDAHMQKGYLENEGILCFLKDDYTISANPMYDIAMGGIKLQVMEEDAERAIQLLNPRDQQQNNVINTSNKLWMVLVAFVVFALLLSLLKCE